MIIIMRERRKENYVSLWTKVGYYKRLLCLYTKGKWSTTIANGVLYYTGS
jgi:hypothetical protein